MKKPYLFLGAAAVILYCLHPALLITTATVAIIFTGYEWQTPRLLQPALARVKRKPK